MPRTLGADATLSGGGIIRVMESKPTSVTLTAIWLLTTGGVVVSAEQPRAISAPVPIESRREAAQAPKPVLAQRKPLSKAAIADLVAALDSRDYAERETATHLLSDAAVTAVPLLTEAARGGSLEQSIRAVRILERIYTNLDGEDESVAAAESALEELARSSQPSTSGRAQAVLVRNSDIRQRRAIAAIERLGGMVQFQDDRFGRPVTENRRVSRVVLGRAWKGGDKGLRYIQRLGNVPDVYVIDGTDVSERAIQDLQQTFPNLRVERRGAAYLGISNGWKLKEGKGFQVGDVVAGEAADKAGIRSGDIVVGFGGKLVPDFRTLVELIGQHDPGDKVTVKLLRPGETKMETVELPVIMGSWTK